jgi:hypothetical protein
MPPAKKSGNTPQYMLSLKQGILPGFTENECFDLNESSAANRHLSEVTKEAFLWKLRFRLSALS